MQFCFGFISADDATSTSSNSDMSQLIQMINQSGGIPIKVTATAATNWSQYFLSLLISSLMLIWIFGAMFVTGVKTAFTKAYFTILKAKTKRHILFIKHTEQGLFDASMIDQKTLSKVAEALNEFKGKPFDMIIHTPGGEVFSAMYISRMLKQYPGHIRTIIPMYSMSGGTLLALSTDELVMAPSSCLGPVDPQLGTLFKFGSAKSWDRILKFKGKKAEDSSISLAYTGKQYTQSIKNHMLKTVDFGLSKSQKETFINFITSGDVEHAYALTPMELKNFGFKIRKIHNDKFMEKMINFISKNGSEGVTYV
jgi:ClpP class serine protease